jgi:FKBP-type peptidyl-prolyl cis-trans isomerase FklB
MDKVSYAIGTQLAQNFKSRSVEIKIKSFVRGIEDVMAGRELALTQEEMKQVMTSFSQRMIRRQGISCGQWKERGRQGAAQRLAV